MEKIIELYNDEKYVCIDEYMDFKIYQEITKYGYYIDNSWLITNDTITITFRVLNNITKDTILDSIASYKAKNKFGFKAFKTAYGYNTHPNGSIDI